jgi:hypothetical protein
MNKKVATFVSVAIIIIFVGYMVYDSVYSPQISKENIQVADTSIPDDAWKIANEFSVDNGKLKTVSCSVSGLIYLGGDSFVSCYDTIFNQIWNLKTDSSIIALSVYGDTVYAATSNQIILISKSGKFLNEWGPYEDNSLITSVSSNKNFIAFADAGNKTVFILDKGGEVKKMIGQSDKQFIIPSPYFDVALDNENNLFTANTGLHRIETRAIDGTIISFFGEPGTAPEYFCGCCAPPHFIVVPQGFVTAEKGINRIKILNKKGEFVEFVNSRNNFVKSVPLDLASSDGKTIYAANPADSKLYIFKRTMKN